MLAARKYVNTSRRLARQRQHLIFNCRCKRWSLIRTYLRVRPLVPSRDGRRLAIRYSLQSLAARIGLHHRSIFRLERKLESQRIILASLLFEEDAKSLASLKDRALAMETAKCKLRQKSKFIRLLSKYRSVQMSRTGGL